MFKCIMVFSCFMLRNHILQSWFKRVAIGTVLLTTFEGCIALRNAKLYFACFSHNDAV